MPSESDIEQGEKQVLQTASCIVHFVGVGLVISGPV
jgi:hypothetical protein